MLESSDGPTWDQLRLYRPAVAALAISASWSYPEGWHLIVAVRHEGEEWADGRRSTYGHLGRGELLQVVDDTLLAVLEL